MLKKSKSKTIVIASILGIILIATISILLWFFNRKFDVTFDLNNGAKKETIQVKYNNLLNQKDIKGKEDLGEAFIDWYEVIEVKNGKDVLAKDPFNFKTKITKNVKLKAIYSKTVETITITFDSNGGSKVEPVTINKGVELSLPENPTKDGFKFITWEDKNGTPIYNNILLSEDTTLYAKWEEENNKEEKDTENNKKEEPKNTKYYCDTGYTLTGTKCTKTEKEKAKFNCPQGYKAGAYEDEYCTDTDYPESELACKSQHGYSENESVLDEENMKCYYRKVTSYPANITHCDMSQGHHYYNGSCYSAVFSAEYIKVCNNGTLTENGECLSKMKKHYYCDDGYTQKDKTCIKTITVNAKKR